MAKAPTTVSRAVDSGTRLDVLLALQARVARTIDDEATPAHALPALAKRLMDISAEIAEMRSNDELERRRGVKAVDESFDATAI